MAALDFSSLGMIVVNCGGCEVSEIKKPSNKVIPKSCILLLRFLGGTAMCNVFILSVWHGEDENESRHSKFVSLNTSSETNLRNTASHDRWTRPAALGLAAPGRSDRQGGAEKRKNGFFLVFFSRFLSPNSFKTFPTSSIV